MRDEHQELNARLVTLKARAEVCELSSAMMKDAVSIGLFLSFVLGVSFGALITLVV